MPRPSHSRRPLTQRHVDVLRLAAQGMTNAKIARALFLSEDTVKTHLSRAFVILGASTRTEAVLELNRLGLLDEPTAAPRYTGPERRRDSAGPGRRAGDARRTHPRSSRP